MRVLATRIPSLPGVSRHAASFSQKLRELVRGCLDKREAIVIDERGRTGGFWDVLSKVLLGRNRITSVSVTPYADAVMEDA
jgi:hypothetical protein